jgi:DDE superfamily endonuclease
MDHLGSHKGKAVRQLIRSAGAKLIFLPKYSPDLNPIEQVLPNSSTCCERCCAHRRSRLRGGSACCSKPSHQRNAPTTSEMQDTFQSKIIAL